MSYAKAIAKHNLHIGNHRFIDDVFADMHIPVPKRINASATLQELCDAKMVPLLMLRKEAFGWRFRQIFGSTSRTYANHTWHSFEKISMLISYHDWSWQANPAPNNTYAGGKYVKSKRPQALISASYSIDKDKFDAFIDAYSDLRPFIDHFIPEYESALDSYNLKKAA